MLEEACRSAILKREPTILKLWHFLFLFSFDIFDIGKERSGNGSKLSTRRNEHGAESFLIQTYLKQWYRTVSPDGRFDILRLARRVEGRRAMCKCVGQDRDGFRWVDKGYQPKKNQQTTPRKAPNRMFGHVGNLRGLKIPAKDIRGRAEKGRNGVWGAKLLRLPPSAFRWR